MKKGSKIVRRWGYSKDDAKIFELAEDAKLPRGYYDTPAHPKLKGGADGPEDGVTDDGPPDDGVKNDDS